MTVYDLTLSTPDGSKIKSGDVLNVPYSGNPVRCNLPSGTYILEVWGAEGGYSYSSSYPGGQGGYSVGMLFLHKNTPLFLYAGGKGQDYGGGIAMLKGGFNGGGDTYCASTSYRCGAGGGASDIRIGEDDLHARVIVAGGGGGAGDYSTSYHYNGGYGGGENGGDGAGQYSTSFRAGLGGTQTAGGTSYNGTEANPESYGTLADFGVGASILATNNSRSGGGGGWYGGGHGYRSPGGGGSGYVYTLETAEYYPDCLLDATYFLADAQTIAGSASFLSPEGVSEKGHSGHGYCRITVIETAKTFDLTFRIPNVSELKVGDVLNIPYSGSAVRFTLPAGKFQLETWGAEGGFGYDANYPGGKGGYSVGTLKTIIDSTLYAYAGGKGQDYGSATGTKTGGFNGGGNGYTSSSTYRVGAGGGASDIRLRQDDLHARIIVAGGGSGAGSYNSSTHYVGADGGGVEGLKGQQYSATYYAGDPGTQTTADTAHDADFGVGGSGTTSYRPGGGGGWYGGGYGYRAPGGGGSGYVFTENTKGYYPECLLRNLDILTDATTIDGSTEFHSPDGTTEIGHTGNGYCRITILKLGIDPTDVELIFKEWDGDPQEYFTWIDMERVEYNANVLAGLIRLQAVDYLQVRHSSQFRYDEAQRLENHIQEMCDLIEEEVQMETDWGQNRTVSYVDFERWERSLYLIYRTLGGKAERLPADKNKVTFSLVVYANEWKGDGPFYQDVKIPYIYDVSDILVYLSHASNVVQVASAYNAILQAKPMEKSRYIRVWANSIKPNIDLPIKISIGGLEMQNIISLPANAWQGNGPWTQTVTLPRTVLNGTIGAHDGMSTEQVVALANAIIHVSNINGNQITVRACGVKPTINLNPMVMWEETDVI